LGLQLMVMGQPFQGFLRIIGIAIEFGAVAGRENGSFVDAMGVEVAQGETEMLVLEGDVLTY